MEWGGVGVGGAGCRWGETGRAGGRVGAYTVRYGGVWLGGLRCNGVARWGDRVGAWGEEKRGGAGLGGAGKGRGVGWRGVGWRKWREGRRRVMQLQGNCGPYQTQETEDIGGKHRTFLPAEGEHRA